MCARAALHDLASDRFRLFAARVVVGDDHVVGKFDRYFAHNRAFPGIPVSTRTEDDMQVSSDMGPDRGQRGFQRIGRMSVINIDLCAIL